MVVITYPWLTSILQHATLTTANLWPIFVDSMTNNCTLQAQAPAYQLNMTMNYRGIYVFPYHFTDYIIFISRGYVSILFWSNLPFLLTHMNENIYRIVLVLFCRFFHIFTLERHRQRRVLSSCHASLHPSVCPSRSLSVRHQTTSRH